MTLSWNVVTKNIRPHDQLQERLRQKVAKLERYLQHFPPDAVHLQIALNRQVKNGEFQVGLNLRLPSNVLHAEKTALDPIPALDQAIKALLRELGGLKSTLRHEAQWNRGVRTPSGQRARFAEAPLRPGEGPQSLSDIVREMTQQHYPQLLYHIRSQIWRAETEGATPRHAIDPEAVADEVARQAFSKPQGKPAEQTYRLWLFSLARRELERRFRDLQDRRRTEVPLDRGNREPEGERDDEGQPSLTGSRGVDGDELQTEDLTPDGHVLSPDAAASESDLVEFLRQTAEQWPAAERNVFQLYFLEGFEPDEIAMLERLKLPEVREMIQQVQARLRQVLNEAALAIIPAKSPPSSRALRV